MALIAALAKYNPCAIYARRGIACPSFGRGRRNRCFPHLTSCDSPDYDGWFRDVLAGRTKSFFPHRIRLLEIPGTFLLVYHTHKHAIVGEAQIVRATSEQSIHNYWFEKFTLYPTPVKPEILHTDSRLAKLSKMRQWKVMYLSEKTLEEIRNFSGLSVGTKEQLKKEARIAKKEVEEHGFSLQRFKTFSIPDEKKRLLGIGISPQVLDKAEEVFLQASKKELGRGRSQKTVFYTCLYLAYRYCHIPMKPRLFEKITGIARARLIDLQPDLPLSGPKEWITYYSGNLGISKETIRIALELVDSIGNKRILGYKSPSAISATALYLACQRTKQDIKLQNVAHTYAVSEATIRSLAKLWQA